MFGKYIPGRVLISLMAITHPARFMIYDNSVQKKAIPDTLHS